MVMSARKLVNHTANDSELINQFIIFKPKDISDVHSVYSKCEQNSITSALNVPLVLVVEKSSHQYEDKLAY